MYIVPKTYKLMCAIELSCNGKKTDTFLVFNFLDYGKQYLLFPLPIDNYI